MPPDSTPHSLREALGAYVRVLRETGRQHVRLSSGARRALATLAAPQKSRSATAAPETGHPVRSPASVSRPASTPARTTPPPRQVAPHSAALPTALTGERIVVAGETRTEKLSNLAAMVVPCQKCPHLVSSRTQTVFGVGNPEAALMFVGEAPGADEDRKGEPFVGPAGQLLTKMIVAMGVQREDVYIANVLKCRPDMPKGSTGNRKPTGSEMQTCLPYLLAQIEIIQPKVIVALGATAVEGLFGAFQPGTSIGRLRGRFMDFHSTPVMATYHPSYLLRNQTISEKRKVWEDLLKVMERLELPISEKQRGYFLPK